MSRPTVRSCLLVLACILVSSLHRPAFAEEAPPAGLRVFTCGHSFHVFVIPLLEAMAREAGIVGHVQVGVSSIGGSTVMKHWDVPDEKNQAKAALQAGGVDVLTLSPIWVPEPGIEKFSRLAVEHNPDVRVLVQEFWLPNDEYEPVYPLQTRKVVDHNAVDLDALSRAHAAYFSDVEQTVNEVNGKIGRPTVRIVPVGQAVLALRSRIAAGTAPGLSHQAELFTDSWGHADATVRVLSAYCHFAVIYGRSPVGLPVPKPLAASKNEAWRDPALNRLLQELAWEAVVQHPMSGVVAEEPAVAPQ